MHRLKFRVTLWTGVALSLLGLRLASTSQLVLAQAAATDTPAAGGSSPTITVGDEGVNVRTGPSSVVYPIIGHMNPGETAPAIAVSPHHEWIEIEYSGTTGWVYTVWVTLSPGFLPVVEPPPTPTPPATATIDPTLAAAFSNVPTPTRLPTFTPAPPLVVPTFANSAASGLQLPMGLTIVVIVLAGALAFGISFFTRR